MKRLAGARSQIQDITGLSRQCSTTEPQQPDDHQPPQSSIRGTGCLSHTSGSQLSMRNQNSKSLYFTILLVLLFSAGIIGGIVGGAALIVIILVAVIVILLIILLRRRDVCLF